MRLPRDEGSLAPKRESENDALARAQRGERVAGAAPGDAAVPPAGRRRAEQQQRDHEVTDRQQEDGEDGSANLSRDAQRHGAKRRVPVQDESTTIER